MRQSAVNKFRKVTVTYQVTYFINGKPVVLTALDPEAFKLTVETMQRRYPDRVLHLSSTCVGSD